MGVLPIRPFPGVTIALLFLCDCCYADNPQTETGYCSNGDDNDCDSAIDCMDTDCCSQSVCAGKGVCGACFDNLVCSLECTVPSTACPATSVDGGTCYYGSTNCCPCFVDATCGACDIPYGHCSYLSSTTTKQTVCSAECVSKILKDPKKNPDGTFANVCDKDSGWQCDYTVTAVQCCGDPDCAGLTCEAEGFGARVKTCKPDDPDKYTCKCGPCSSNNDCVDQCCEKDPNINKDVNGDEKIEDCVGVGSTVTVGTKSYLCAKSSPVSWHECNAENIGKNIMNGKSYICLNQNGGYTWFEITLLKDAMLAGSLAFVLIILLKKNVLRKKDTSLLLLYLFHLQCLPLSPSLFGFLCKLWQLRMGA